MRTEQQAAPLTGKALVDQVKKLANKSNEEKARACGYYTVTKNGLERVNMMKFLNALIDAEGINIDSQQSRNPVSNSSEADFDQAMAAYRVVSEKYKNALRELA